MDINHPNQVFCLSAWDHGRELGGLGPEPRLLCRNAAVSTIFSLEPHIPMACLIQIPFNFQANFFTIVPLSDPDGEAISNWSELFVTKLPQELELVESNSRPNSLEILMISYESKSVMSVWYGLRTSPGDSNGCEPDDVIRELASLIASSLYRDGFGDRRNLVRSNSRFDLSSHPDPCWYHAHAAALMIANSSMLGSGGFLFFPMDWVGESVWEVGDGDGTVPESEALDTDGEKLVFLYHKSFCPLLRVRHLFLASLCTFFLCSQICVSYECIEWKTHKSSTLDVA